MLVPMMNEHPVELGLGVARAAVCAQLAQQPEYARGFAQAFPGEATPVTLANLIRAIAAFERTLIFGRSPFDRYVFDGEHTALSPQAKRGMALFFSARAGCSSCHSGFNFAGNWRDAHGADRAGELCGQRHRGRRAARADAAQRRPHGALHARRPLREPGGGGGALFRARRRPRARSPPATRRRSPQTSAQRWSPSSKASPTRAPRRSTRSPAAPRRRARVCPSGTCPSSRGSAASDPPGSSGRVSTWYSPG